ncbi:site-specific DNA-methyltransferase [Propionivibrio sp.]|uniref:site-specific DNA-methyltransferase n=1 Tax=Propionivibrio sp. TaxID=2212460 RepID=UPI00261C2452|nr:site-specific DNA-methyltransferase [Propionivibrio sp.]
MKKQKLELTWIGKDVRPKVEPRILLGDPSMSYHAKHRVTSTDLFDNQLIFGDNLLALKALEQDYAGKVKCVFIDPPYNTGSAFTHYDDGVEHSIWLSLIRDRLEIIRRLLSEDGSLWITIDDNEAHYLKVLCDEVFGRRTFVANVVWQNRYSRSNDASLSLSHNSILVYAQNPDKWKKIRNRLTRTEEQAGQYKNLDKDMNGPWRAIPWDAPNLRPNLTYPITTPTGKVRLPPPGRCWSRTEDQWLEIVETGLAYFGKSGDGVPSFKQYLKDAAAIVPNTWWPHEEAGHTDEAKKEMHELFGKEKAFDTPKPERLLQRIIHIATNPSDLVLDSFAGSGTTGAVAHKMGRRWIMIELGEHCHTHIIPRLKKVIDGDDQGGISQAVNWKGGGGFRYYCLAPSLLQQDRWGQWIINKDYNAEMLAAAICKLEGFTYAPSDAHYWQHGKSTENDFIYVTTQSLMPEQLQALSEEVGEERSLLVCCSAFRGDANRFPNLTVKKIPKMVLSRCEWGHDDYSLNVENLPMASPPELAVTAAAPASSGRKSAKSVDAGQAGLFDGGDE